MGDFLSAGELRSYSGLGVLEAVEDKTHTYRFLIDIQQYIGRYSLSQPPSLPASSA